MLNNPIRYSDPLGDSTIKPEQLPVDKINPWALNKLGKFIPKDNPRPLKEQIAGDLKLAAIFSGAFGVGLLGDALAAGSISLQGGRKGDIETQPGIDRHEIPSAQSMKEGAGVKTDDVPVVQLPTELHSQTNTCGGSRLAQAARSAETSLVKAGKMTEAFEQGVNDLRNLIKTDQGKTILQKTGYKPSDVEKAIKMMQDPFKRTINVFH